jgi:ATP-binding cassette subfamily C (CFTR/MRP) protein 1
VVAVYRKALVLSAGERQTRTLGEITNLMSIDAQRLQDLTNYLHALWYSPLQIALALFFLWQQMGASSMGGVAVIVVMIPVTKMVAQWMGTQQKSLMHAKDRRVEVNSEVLSSMKVIKFQAWEEAFQDRIMALRQLELQQLFKYFIGLSLSRMLWTFTPLLVALATFASYVWSGHQLDVASALTALSLFDILRFPLFMLPQIINNTVESMVAVQRVESFLRAQDHHSVEAADLVQSPSIRLTGVTAAYESRKPKVTPDMDTKDRQLIEKEWQTALLQAQLDDAERRLRMLQVKKDNGSETVGESSPTDMGSSSHGGGGADESGHTMSSLLCLRRIDFEVQPGEMIAIVGGVGCSKSSMLNAMLGEVKELSGQTAVRGSLAYFSQTPFIMNASVRDNILFGHIGEDVDEELYQRAIKCCALEHDLKLLSDGDMTEIGEKGITLSGGQKARVALARAVYHEADCTLVDDALSAVDAHVAKTIFNEAIVQELLRPRKGDTTKRSVVLVTNALQYLNHPRVDRIVVMKEGAIAEQGTFQELSEQPDSQFSRFLSVIRQTGVSKDVLDDSHVDSEISSDLNRRESVKAQQQTTKPAKLMKDEARMTGHVDIRVYWTWAKAAGGILAPLGILLGFSFTEGINVLSNWWLTYWSNHATPETQAKFLAIYALINFGSALANFLRMIFLLMIGLRAAKVLFSDLLLAVLRAPMSFFDTTPVGRIVNRFSKDVYGIDEQLMSTLRTYLQTLFNVLSTIVVISTITPIFTICLIPIILFYAMEQAHFTVS